MSWRWQPMLILWWEQPHHRQSSKKYRILIVMSLLVGVDLIDSKQVTNEKVVDLVVHHSEIALHWDPPKIKVKTTKN